MQNSNNLSNQPEPGYTIIKVKGDIDQLYFNQCMRYILGHIAKSGHHEDTELHTLANGVNVINDVSAGKFTYTPKR